MRLTNTATLELHEFLSSHCPRYGILSHRWGPDEATYSDYNEGRRRDTSGYEKIASFCAKARKDGLEWVWIDTCCIDKRSSAELSEAINSMFQWYEDATACYAYLSDVRDLYESASTDMFKYSAWWTRGWTLQELIAPREVEFFDASWSYLGSRSGLASTIAEITGIDVALLKRSGSGVFNALETYSVARRFSWAAARHTTRVEDAAYALIGLFNVNMPLLYGEGANAFRRLQLEILKLTPDLSVLAWSPSPGMHLGQDRGPLATHPQDFVDCGHISRVASLTDVQDAASDVSSTALALRVTAPFVEIQRPGSSEKGFVALLGCREDDDFTTALGLKVTLLGTSRRVAMSERELRCVPGWPADDDHQRLYRVDVLFARRHSTVETMSLAWQRAKEEIPRNLQNRELNFLWFRFEDQTLVHAWKVIDLFPKQYWRHQNLTFDLTRARQEKAAADAETAARPWPSVFGLPIYGAIALEAAGGFRVAVFFCQRNAATESGLTYDVARYDQKTFQSPERRLLDRNIGTLHEIGLLDGSTLKVDIGIEEISGETVAHLAACVGGAPKPPTYRRLSQIVSTPGTLLTNLARVLRSQRRTSALELDQEAPQLEATAVASRLKSEHESFVNDLRQAKSDESMESQRDVTGTAELRMHAGDARKRRRDDMSEASAPDSTPGETGKPHKVRKVTRASTRLRARSER